MEKTNDYPVLFYSKDECCGCTACSLVCSRQIIEMKCDDEGFEYPFLVDIERCIRCQQCIDVCPQKN